MPRKVQERLFETRNPISIPIAALIAEGLICILLLVVAAIPSNEYLQEVEHNPYQGRGVSAADVLLLDSVSGAILAAPDVPAHAWLDAQRVMTTHKGSLLPSPQAPQAVTGWLAELAGCHNMPLAPTVAWSADDLARRRSECNVLQTGASSSMARSLIVMFCFVNGIAVMPRLEAWVRRGGYGSRPGLHRLDRLLLLALAVGVILVSVALRIVPG